MPTHLFADVSIRLNLIFGLWVIITEITHFDFNSLKPQA